MIDLSRVKPKRKSVYPNQFICREVANGVFCNGNFYPYRSEYALSAGVVIPKKKGVRYFIKSVSLTMKADAADTGTAEFVYAVQDGEISYIATIMRLTLTPGSWYYQYSVGVLFDENKDVTLIATNISDAYCVIVYAAVDVEPGNRKPKVIIE